MHEGCASAGQSLGPGPVEAAVAGGTEAQNPAPSVPDDTAAAGSVACVDGGEHGEAMLVDGPPIANPASAAAREHKRAALERQGLSPEEIGEILEDPDADEEEGGTYLGDEWINVRMEE
ncbi:hypothetical protein B0H14DRAFT_2561877 [Mycena olivaceomarginata]|nr:hypothetical protein B0H14DRAFT_2561877 [Mycena olivaceomarginata]